MLLRSGEASAEITVTGGELLSWRIGDHELLWQGNPDWWDRSAPILFPVVGASRNNHVTIGGKRYPMPVHGFAKDKTFHVVTLNEASLTLRLESSAESHDCYPFDFTLDVTFSLTEMALHIGFDVVNSGATAFPYALGFHPGFAWPAGQGELLFETAESGDIPCITSHGLLSRETRTLPLQGHVLPFTPDCFSRGALVFRSARSRDIVLSRAGEAIRMQMDNFRHLAIWSRPQAPFVCMEAWTAHADWDDFDGELALRDNMILLPPGQSEHHGILLEKLPKR